MKPDETNSSQSGMPLLPQRSVIGDSNQQSQQPTQELTAQVIRSQIDDLFDKRDTPTSVSTSQEPPVTVENANPYHRTHTEHAESQPEQWKQYHTAWQDYYQKYYESYYSHHLQKAQHALKEQSINSQQKIKTKPDEIPSDEEIVSDLHQKLIGKVQESATKVKKSRHFVPVIAGVVVVLIFLFLQYNRIFISNVMAYVSPGNIDPQNIVVSPNTDIKVGPEPRLIIPKINIDVPVIYDIGNDYDSQMTAMTKGVAQFAVPGASSHPGEIGNTVIAGHSSNDLLDSGDYKFIFAQLDKLNAGDTVYANYQSKRYTYIVTKKEVVKPSEVNKLVYETTEPVLTLLTCTPIGTDFNRLLVTAKQIIPSPDQATTTPAKEGDNKLQDSSIPGNSPTFFERLFGGG
jgi:sortase A